MQPDADVNVMGGILRLICCVVCQLALTCTPPGNDRVQRRKRTPIYTNKEADFVCYYVDRIQDARVEK